MSISSMMRHTINLYRAVITQGTAQQITGYELVGSGICCFIQPATSEEAFYYSQRGLENVHLVYSNDTTTEFLRNDILEHGSRQFHVVGVKNALELNLYIEMTTTEYPEGARKRLNKEVYT